jgi:rhodanese-related sulfurtransferase
MLVWTRNSTTQQSPLTAPQALPAMGITAALGAQSGGAVLVDSRAPDSAQLRIPDSIPWQSAKRLASGTRIVLLGNAGETYADAIMLAKRQGLVPLGFVPASTLNRLTVMNGESSEISCTEALGRLRHGQVKLLDVREPDEFNGSYVPGSQRLAFGAARRVLLASTEPTAVLCMTGHRSAILIRELEAQGCKNLLSVNGGWLEWKSQALPLVENGQTKEQYHD